MSQKPSVLKLQLLFFFNDKVLGITFRILLSKPSQRSIITLQFFTSKQSDSQSSYIPSQQKGELEWLVTKDEKSISHHSKKIIFPEVTQVSKQQYSNLWALALSKEINLEFKETAQRDWGEVTSLEIDTTSNKMQKLSPPALQG